MTVYSRIHIRGATDIIASSLPLYRRESRDNVETMLALNFVRFFVFCFFLVRELFVIFELNLATSPQPAHLARSACHCGYGYIAWCAVGSFQAPQKRETTSSNACSKFQPAHPKHRFRPVSHSREDTGRGRPYLISGGDDYSGLKGLAFVGPRSSHYTAYSMWDHTMENQMIS